MKPPSLLRHLSTYAGIVSNFEHYYKASTYVTSSHRRPANNSRFSARAHRVRATKENPTDRLYNAMARSLHVDPSLRKSLEPRTSVIQQFVGDRFPLDFHQCLAILCGPSSGEIKFTKQRPDGNILEPEETRMGQDRVRKLGQAFFDYQCLHLAIYSDLLYLHTPDSMLRRTQRLLANSTSLVLEFMSLNALDLAVIPYKGLRRNYTPKQALFHRQKIRQQSTEASFYTLLGVLIVKFGSQTIRDEFWDSKVFGSGTGLLKIALNRPGAAHLRNRDH